MNSTASRSHDRQRTGSVEETLRQWFASDENPTDFYQLLGKPRLDPSRAELLDAVRSAYRALHSIENHAAAARLPRARLLQKMIVEAEQIIEGDAQWRAYDESLALRLRMQYVTGAGRDPSTWRLENLRLWLARTQNVHPSRVDELVASFLASGAAAAEQTMASGALETVKEVPSKSGAGAVTGSSAEAGVARVGAGAPSVPRPARPVDRQRESGGRSDAAIPVATPVAPPAQLRAAVRPSAPGAGSRELRRPPEVGRSGEARGLSRPAPGTRSQPSLPAVTPPSSSRRAAVAGAVTEASLVARAWNNLLWTVATALVTAVVFGGVGVAIVLSRR